MGHDAALPAGPFAPREGAGGPFGSVLDGPDRPFSIFLRQLRPRTALRKGGPDWASPTGAIFHAARPGPGATTRLSEA
jgi:hypothetical protein